MEAHGSAAHRPVRPRIVLAEDDGELRALLASVLAEQGDVTVARDGIELRNAIGVESPDLVVADASMRGASGLAVLTEMHRSKRRTRWIVITAFGDLQVHAEAKRCGALAVIDKPFELDALRETVRSALVPAGTPVPGICPSGLDCAPVG